MSYKRTFVHIIACIHKNFANLLFELNSTQFQALLRFWTTSKSNSYELSISLEKIKIYNVKQNMSDTIFWYIWKFDSRQVLPTESFHRIVDQCLKIDQNFVENFL